MGWSQENHNGLDKSISRTRPVLQQYHSPANRSVRSLNYVLQMATASYTFASLASRVEVLPFVFIYRSSESRASAPWSIHHNKYSLPMRRQNARPTDAKAAESRPLCEHYTCPLPKVQTWTPQSTTISPLGTSSPGSTMFQWLVKHWESLSSS